MPADLDDAVDGRNFALFYEATATEDTSYKVRVIARAVATTEPLTLGDNLMFGYKILNSGYTLSTTPRASC